MSDESTPDSITFASLGLSSEVLQAIDDMGWQDATPVQAACFKPAIEGKDLIVQSRTGTGKTGAFGLPLVNSLVDVDGGPQALVLAPTRELAMQSAREMSKFGSHRGVSAIAIYGGASFERQVEELSKGAQIISGTPGRILDHFRQGTINTAVLKVLVLDEADEMLSMGFAKELHAILEQLPKSRQTLLFSATVDGPVKRMAERHTTDPEHISLSGDHVGALGIEHVAYMVRGVGRTSDLISVLRDAKPASAIIFCNMKSETEEVAARLKKEGFNADWLNGDLPQKERERILQRVRNEELQFLVATDVAARGIDVSHVTHVINYSLPDNLEQYVHRTGRTGRAGRTGTALTLVGPVELGALHYLRLQFGITPTPRHLPSSAEARTAAQAQLASELVRLFAVAASPDELALVRRMLTHDRREQVIAGLVRAALNQSDDVRLFATTADNKNDSDDQGGKNQGKNDSTSSAPKKKPASSSRRSETSETNDAPKDAPKKETWITLRVSIGRNHDVRASQISKALRDACELRRADLGRIRMRDDHSLVDIRADLSDEVMKRAEGVELDNVTLSFELA